MLTYLLYFVDDIKVICNELCLDIEDITKRDEKYFENFRDKNIIQKRSNAFEQKRLYYLNNILKKWKIIWDIQNKNKTCTNFFNNTCDITTLSTENNKIKLRP
jgi:hypothetical protein